MNGSFYYVATNGNSIGSIKTNNLSSNPSKNVITLSACNTNQQLSPLGGLILDPVNSSLYVVTKDSSASVNIMRSTEGTGTAINLFRKEKNGSNITALEVDCVSGSVFYAITNGSIFMVDKTNSACNTVMTKVQGGGTTVTSLLYDHINTSLYWTDIDNDDIRYIGIKGSGASGSGVIYKPPSLAGTGRGSILVGDFARKELFLSDVAGDKIYKIKYGVGTSYQFTTYSTDSANTPLALKWTNKCIATCIGSGSSDNVIMTPLM